MTLGRTSSNAIKIKTDSPGLRAVECACCGGVSCGCRPMSAAVNAAIASATQVTVNSLSIPWNGSTASSGQQGFGVLTWNISYSGGTLCFYGDDGENTYQLMPDSLEPIDCFIFGDLHSITIQGVPYRAMAFFPPFPGGSLLSISISFS